MFRSELVALYFNEWNIISTTPNGSKQYLRPQRVGIIGYNSVAPEPLYTLLRMTSIRCQACLWLQVKHLNISQSQAVHFTAKFKAQNMSIGISYTRRAGTGAEQRLSSSSPPYNLERLYRLLVTDPDASYHSQYLRCRRGGSPFGSSCQGKGSSV